jgi:tetratricopeptide (TPR) repeat protein
VKKVAFVALVIRSALGTAGLCCALAGGACSRARPVQEHSPVAAMEQLEATGAKTVYFTGAAFAALVGKTLQNPPPWLPSTDREAASPRVRAMAQAALDPKLFRQLDRQERFDALILAGDPVRYRPLQEHLLRTQDWTLEWVDPWCLLYRRGKVEPLTAEKTKELAARLAQGKGGARAQSLAAMAERLVGARRFEEALALLGQAREADAGEPAVWTAEGSYRLARGEWPQAVAMADKALSLDKGWAAAKAVKAQGLYFSKRYEEAYQLSRELLEGAPEDPVMLFAHAKIAHEVRSLQEEVEVLRKLIGFAEREKRSTSAYRVYLGQALAMRGAGEQALVELDAALADPELPPDQLDFARSARARVDLKVHPPGSLPAGGDVAPST